MSSTDLTVKILPDLMTEYAGVKIHADDASTYFSRLIAGGWLAGLHDISQPKAQQPQVVRSREGEIGRRFSRTTVDRLLEYSFCLLDIRETPERSVGRRDPAMDTNEYCIS